ncbi:fungal-specific transcription factor domain-containing protein [Aspergillus pseudoustus]|uniref:Fungal-specific transcription factor domain-containing protein n=1 Tax=Aspergillus pseudoustus TaxID=1810923 RepID=A0ABR4K7Y0_9EURO
MGRRWKNACHTCRRRRLRCDEAKPLCQRCSADGIECQGYGNLILWVDGIASRGKMMGKSYNVAQSTPAAARTATASETISSSTPNNDLSSYQVAPLTHPTTTPEPEPILYYTPLDPWSQQFDHPTRHYLSHFLIHVGNDLIVHNVPSHNPNPLRLLLGLAQRNSSLFHIIVAMSAEHLYNLLLRSPDAQTYHVDGLRSKGKALQLLSDELRHIAPSNYTAVLASSMLFSELAILETGDDTWRIHVAAAARLVQDMAKLLHELGAEQYTFCSWIISRLILQDMFGSSLSSATTSWNVHEFGGPHASMDSALRIAELDHYSSCPAQVSRLIIAASAQYRTPSQSACCDDSTPCIFSSIQEFDPGQWALTLQPLTPTDDFTERYHIGSAYKAAAAIYVAQLLPAGYACDHLPTQPQSLVDEILHHLVQIPRTNPLFKSTIWPNFIAGAETTNPQQRSQVLEHLSHLSIAIPWQSMFIAEQSLKDFWARTDQSNSLLSSDILPCRRKWIDEFRTMSVSIYPA